MCLINECVASTDSVIMWAYNLWKEIKISLTPTVLLEDSL